MMTIVQSRDDWPGNLRGTFRIRRMRPGRGLGLRGDDGLGPLGTVDRASLAPGLTVPMHEHRDDEILSYLRAGELHHRDSTGAERVVSPSMLMLMNAGHGISHEEKVPSSARGTTEMLQIFVRPRAASLPPRLQFHACEPAPPAGRWRTLAVPEGEDGPLVLRNRVWLLDRSMNGGETAELPVRPAYALWLHVFSGSGTLGDGSRLESGDSAAILGATSAEFAADAATDLVAFQIDLHAGFTRAGSLSG